MDQPRTGPVEDRGERSLRDRDNAFRMKVGDRLASLKEGLGRLKFQWAAEQHLGLLSEVDHLIRRTEQVRDAVRFARNGTEGLLQAVGLPAERLPGLDDLDRVLLDVLARLEAQVAALRAPRPDHGPQHASIPTVERSLADLAALVTRRHNYLLGHA